MTEYSRYFLQNLYKTMVKIRLCEESFVDLILDGTIKCPVHLCTGQEAVAVGICANLRKDDVVFGGHRSHGHYLAKGGNLNALVAEIYGKETGCSGGKGGSMHIIDKSAGFSGSIPIVSGTVSLALGASMFFETTKKKNVVVTFFGDGAVGEGVVFESLNFASLRKLPILFVCENNLYSTHMPIKECRPTADIYKMAQPLGISSFQVDGNNVIKVYEIARKAVNVCRRSKGPVFIECLTYRTRGHVGPDDNIQGAHVDIRPSKEIKKWKARDPIEFLEKLLIKNQVFTKKQLLNIKKIEKKNIKKAHEYANKSFYPKKKELFKNV